MKKLLPFLSPVIKGAGLVAAGIAKFSVFLPESWVIYGLMVGLAASTVGDFARKLGDLLDDGVENGSYDPEAS